MYIQGDKITLNVYDFAVKIKIYHDEVGIFIIILIFVEI